MAEFKFSCTSCGQHIQCDGQWSGRQISCPVCGASLVVPHLKTAPITAPVTAPVFRPAPASASGSPVKKIALWSVGLAVLAVGMYFGLREADVLQGAFNKKQKDIVAHSDGGELTHIANVYATLDATDPAKAEARQIKASQRAERERSAMLEAAKLQPDPSLALPLLPADWTLDAAAAKIPNGRVHGMISGAEFKVDTVRLDPNGLNSVLAFQEGVGTAADHEMFIYLNVNNNENLAGRSWSVTRDMKGKDAPAIIKRWTANPKYAPLSKTFNSGYALRLEFGQPTRDWLPGRIYLALPDTNQTVLAGSFSLPQGR
ncbi:MAG TPA: hypothetical protein VHB20_09365 [Verrucomicrobiae bacterium]|jgi:hypothetical protein|nr:hypothetical protein [Verrucomicrobiae bacterium]